MIILYTKPNCPFCLEAKKWLQANYFEYREIDVSVDEKSRIFLKVQGLSTVPQIFHNNELLVADGYAGLEKENPEELRRKLIEKDMF
jgi:glutaredoxin